MFAWRRVSEKAAKGTLIGVTALVAMRFYYVREMLAAFVLFSVLFGCVAAVLAMLFILDRAARATTGFFELRGKEALQHARAWHRLSEPRPWIHR
jgi:hypothetical protein